MLRPRGLALMNDMPGIHLRILKPGLFTTVQDLGRPGYQRFGVSVGGAMDQWAHRLVNRLVGNPDEAATLEITLAGPHLQFEREGVIAIGGADLSPALDGSPLPMWTAVFVTAGAQLVFGPRRSGARAYLAVAGGLDLPLVLGSRATDLRSRLGGLDGRRLAENDALDGGRPATRAEDVIGRVLPADVRPTYRFEPTVRAVAGPQAERFHPEAFEVLQAGRYLVTPQSNRMGYRLTGAPLKHIGSSDMISDATPFGAIQVPGNQQPILLMADRQTTGGYPKIAVVVSADLPLAAQLAPGDALRFSLVDAVVAAAELREHHARLDRCLPPTTVGNVRGYPGLPRDRPPYERRG